MESVKKQSKDTGKMKTKMIPLEPVSSKLQQGNIQVLTLALVLPHLLRQELTVWLALNLKSSQILGLAFGTTAVYPSKSI